MSLWRMSEKDKGEEGEDAQQEAIMSPLGEKRTAETPRRWPLRINFWR